MQFFVLLTDEDIWHTDKDTHLDRAVEFFGDFLRNDGLLGYAICFDWAILRIAGRKRWGRQRECRQSNC